MKLFTVGPVEMYPDTLDAASRQLPYFRTEDFSAMMKESEAILKRLTHSSDDSRVIFLTASGTGAMEATVMNLLGKDSHALIINGGSFGHRFCKICDIHGIPYESVDLKFGEVLISESLPQRKYDALLINLDETSTGQLYDLGMISEYCKRTGCLLIVDAISSFLADDLNVGNSGIDALIISSQKALALSPGLSMVVVNRRVREIISGNTSGSLYFDFKMHLEDMERGQTPFTPAVGILIELNVMLRELEKIGIDEKIKRTAGLARYFRKKAQAAGLNIPAYPLSNAVTPILFDDGSAYALFEILKDTYGLCVTPSGGDLKTKMVRVSHIGNLSEADYDHLLDCISEARAVIGK